LKALSHVDSHSFLLEALFLSSLQPRHTQGVDELAHINMREQQIGYVMAYRLARQTTTARHACRVDAIKDGLGRLVAALLLALLYSSA
jgi:hypothetical protein